MDLLSSYGAEVLSREHGVGGFYEGTVRGGKPLRPATPISILRSAAGGSRGVRLPVPGRSSASLTTREGLTLLAPELPAGTGPCPTSPATSLAASLSWEGGVPAVDARAAACCGGTAAVPPSAQPCAPLESVCSSPVHGLVLIESDSSNSTSKSDSRCSSSSGGGWEGGATGPGLQLAARRPAEGWGALHSVLAAEVAAKALSSPALPPWQGRHRSVGSDAPASGSVLDVFAPAPAEAASGDVELQLAPAAAPLDVEAGDGFRFPLAAQTTNSSS